MKITTNQLEVLKASDPILAKILVGKIKRNFENRTVYQSLLSSIISQQISLSAAASIKKKFLDLFEGKYPEFEKLISADEKDLRSCGLSGPKVSYMKNVAKHFLDESLDETKFLKMSDEEIINDLTKIKGVGKWTVEMILIFTLKRPDIFSVKDIGLINPICELYKINKKRTKPKNLERKLLQISKKWSPYRTVASLYLWQFKDTK